MSVCKSVCWSHTVSYSGSPCSCPSRFTQMDCDGHLAQCLSEVNVDVTWWANRMLAAVPELWAAQMPRTLRHHIIWWRTHSESNSLFSEVLTPETGCTLREGLLNTLAYSWRWVNRDVHLSGIKTREVGRTFWCYWRGSTDGCRQRTNVIDKLQPAWVELWWWWKMMMMMTWLHYHFTKFCCWMISS